MGNEKYEAIVLRVVKYGDHDKMLTLFTKEHGKMSAVAKGAQSSKSKYIASAQRFCMSEFILSDSGKIPYVKSADVIRGFYGLNHTIDTLSAASYCAELMNLGFEEHVADVSAFHLLYHTFRFLEECRSEQVFSYVLAFALKLMGLSGMYPILDRCAYCEKTKDRYYFDANMGGLICLECKDTNLLLPKISDKQAEYLYRLLYIDLNQLSQIPIIDHRIEKYLLKLINDYIIFHYNKKIKSFDLLYSL